MYNTYNIKGKIVLLSGLHIGGNDVGVKIGGIDSPVIKNAITGLPYIPGSSLKGKMRFLLEHYLNYVTNSNGDIPIQKDGRVLDTAILFGFMTGEKEQKEYPTRVIFRDAQLIGAYDLAQSGSPSDGTEFISIEKAIRNMGTKFVECKTEVAIDRAKGTVKQKGGGLRQIERVPAGTVFEFEIILREFKEGEGEHNLSLLQQGLKLLENDAIGGSGSRGSGHIMFLDLAVDGEPFKLEDVSLTAAR